mmetsp:Transcript_98388/g.175185  ORF Transcript_98388/g.175185 Transcript_98388/m.175185 type:complete len:763 (+) Transcript_98388:76-2364(+)
MKRRSSSVGELLGGLDLFATDDKDESDNGRSASKRSSSRPSEQAKRRPRSSIASLGSEMTMASAEESSQDGAQEDWLRQMDSMIEKRHSELLERLETMLSNGNIGSLALPAGLSAEVLEAATKTGRKGIRQDAETEVSRKQDDGILEASPSMKQGVGRSGESPKKRWEINQMPLLEDEEYEAIADARSRQRTMNIQDEDESDLQASGVTKWKRRFSEFVQSRQFEGFFAITIITNSLLLGIQVEYSAENIDDPETPLAFEVMNQIYAALFFFELVARIGVYQMSFFIQEDKGILFWNYLDMTIVGTSIFEVALAIMMAGAGDSSSAAQGSGEWTNQTRIIRMLRIARVIRVMRVLKVVKFIRALASLISSIVYTLKALMWSIFLLLMIIYVFSILFADTVMNHLQTSYLPLADLDPDSTESQLHQNFGSLIRSMHVLFRSISGGVDWGVLADELNSISPVYAYLFISYIAFCYFAVLNVMTAVFCQRAIESAERDQEHVLQSMLSDHQRHTETISRLFEVFDGSSDGTITLMEFESMYDDESVRAMFQSLDLTASDAWTLFKLLDAESNGDIDLREFMDGCMRLRGPAKAMDIACIMDESRRIKRKVVKTEERLDHMDKLLSKLSVAVLLLQAGGSKTQAGGFKQSQDQAGSPQNSEAEKVSESGKEESNSSPRSSLPDPPALPPKELPEMGLPPLPHEEHPGRQSLAPPHTSFRYSDQRIQKPVPARARFLEQDRWRDFDLHYDIGPELQQSVSVPGRLLT